MPEVKVARYCTSCGNALEAAWTHCPSCGTKRVVATLQKVNTPPAAKSTRFTDVRILIDEGRLNEAEARTRAALDVQKDVETLLLLAQVLQLSGRYSDAMDYLLEAKEVDPADPFARLRLAEYYGRLALHQKAFEELEIARRNFSPEDIHALIYCQDLHRWLREKSKSNFVRQSALPHLPSWLSGFGKRHASPSSEAS